MKRFFCAKFINFLLKQKTRKKIVRVSRKREKIAWRCWMAKKIVCWLTKMGTLLPPPPLIPQYKNNGPPLTLVLKDVGGEAFVLLEKQIGYCLEMRSIYVTSFFAWAFSMALDLQVVIEKRVLNQDHRSCEKFGKIWPRESWMLSLVKLSGSSGICQ